MTGREVLQGGVARLRDAGVPDPATDGRRLLAHALDVSSDRLTLLLFEPVNETARHAFDAAVTARCAFRPVSQIIGQRLFYGRAFEVTSDVLDPRPETETLVVEALKHRASRILDLGTGSGCILLTLLSEWPGAQGLGTDISERALSVATRNAESLSVADRASFKQANWFDGVDGEFDLIVSNPPYVTEAEYESLARDVRTWEPRQALTPGTDGLDAYRTLIPAAVGHLSRQGRVLCEIGPTQAAEVSKLARSAGFNKIDVFPDLDGRDRVVSMSLRSVSA